jgi:hypothetical protein
MRCDVHAATLRERRRPEAIEAAPRTNQTLALDRQRADGREFSQRDVSRRIRVEPLMR